MQVASIHDGIEQINTNVTNISALHARTLNVMDTGRDQDAARLDELTAETRNIINNLKDRIKALDREPMAVDAQMRRNRVRTIDFATHLFNLPKPNIIDSSRPHKIHGSLTDLSTS
jgi:syntaxin 1B/2/3